MKWISWVASTAIRCVRKNGRCPREKMLEVLSDQVLRFTGQVWLAAGMQVVQTEESIVVFFLCPDGSSTDSSIVISSWDPLYYRVKMKMDFASRRHAMTLAS